MTSSTSLRRIEFFHVKDIYIFKYGRANDSVLFSSHCGIEYVLIFNNVVTLAWLALITITFAIEFMWNLLWFCQKISREHALNIGSGLCETIVSFHMISPMGGSFVRRISSNIGNIWMPGWLYIAIAMSSIKRLFDDVN